MLLFAVVAFAACEQAPINEKQGAAINERNLEVSFEGGDDTRIQLQNGKTVWTEGDHVSVFYRSTVNEEWQFMGETGDRIGNIVPVDNTLNPPATHNRVVVIYPYNNEYYLNTETYSIEASLPAVQNYLEDSYGTNGNIMVSSGDYKQVSLKSVCGWLKLQLTGDGEVVKSITLRGNDGEQVAGELYINTSDATCVLASASGDAGESEVGGTLVRPGTILTDVTLDCGEGVTLGKSATAFYIALPPQTFANGFTVEIEDADGYAMEQSTAKTFVVERNTISPMAALEFVNPNRPTQPTPANNEIWYIATAKVEPTFDDFLTFGSDVVSNVWDSETKRGIITFDGDVTMIGDDAFNNCDKFTGITLPESVTSIGKNAFYDCDGLTEFIIPDSVTTIGDYAFQGCDSLTSVTIPDRVTEIGYAAFYDCGSLQEFNGKFASEDGRCLIIDGTLNAFAPAGLTEYAIPDGVTSIGDYVFYSCSNLASVTIPSSVTTIGDYAFYGCTSLTSITIPDSVTTIGDYAFRLCTSLTNVNIPDSVTEIGEVAFRECISLTSVTIPDSVTTIGNSAFAYCSSLKSVTIGDSITTIGMYAFNGCSSLKKVYCNATIPPSLSNPVFSNNATGRRIYVYEECVELYKSAWSSYKDSIYTNGQNCPTTTIEYTTNDGNTITSSKLLIISNIYENGVGTMVVAGKISKIPEGAFSSCTSLTSVNIPEGVTKIGDYAFRGCESLTSVNIPDGVTSIGMLAFSGCSSLTSVTIPDSVTKIGYEAFAHCDSLTSVNIGDSVTTIGSYAFEYCSSLKSVNIPDSVTTIAYAAFQYCTSLTNVTIPDSVTTIGDYAFKNCDSLTNVYCKATTPPALGGTSVFDYNGGGRKIYVPAESVDAYKSATNWSEYKSAIVGYNF